MMNYSVNDLLNGAQVMASSVLDVVVNTIFSSIMRTTVAGM